MQHTFSFLTVIAGVTLYLNASWHVHTGLKGRFRIFRLKISQLPALCQQIPALCGGFSLWKVPICTSPLHRHVFYEFMPVLHQRNRTMIVGKISPFVNGIDKFFADTVPFRQIKTDTENSKPGQSWPYCEQNNRSRLKTEHIKQDFSSLFFGNQW